jgi:hypothetical protein
MTISFRSRTERAQQTITSAATHVRFHPKFGLHPECPRHLAWLDDAGRTGVGLHHEELLVRKDASAFSSAVTAMARERTVRCLTLER